MQTAYFDELAFEVLRLAANGTRSVLVTSTGAGEGKSTITSGLARALARSRRRSVLAMDGDRLKPTLHGLFGLANGRGLAEVLTEVYQCDLTRERPDQFGVGDWLELLMVQERSGRLVVREGEQEFTLMLSRGVVAGLHPGRQRPELRLGRVLAAHGAVSETDCEAALRIQQDRARPLGEILTGLGCVTAEALDAALRVQRRDAFQRLLALRRPVCTFHESVEGWRPAASGRDVLWPVEEGLQHSMRPWLTEYMKQPWLISQVAGYLQDTPLPNLKVLSAGTDEVDLRERVFRNSFEALLGHAERMFDTVLVDSPPVAIGSPATALASLVDGVVLVVRAGACDVRAVQLARQRLQDSGGRLLGVVLNHADLSEQTAYTYAYTHAYAQTGERG